MKDDNTQKIIQDKFKDMVENMETDPNLKQEVFDTISSFESIASVIDLFTGKFIKTEVAFIADITARKDSFDDNTIDNQDDKLKKEK